MEMLDMPVTLIVKAPNQQVEDQTIHCELNWTIRKLKGYLSEVYPSKPRTEDQKLIYSGQLLHDSVTLKDVLRRYEGQETHTVHLVCTPSRDSRHFNSVTVTKTLTRMSDNGGQPPTTTTREAAQREDREGEGVRHRLTASSSAPQPTPQPCNSTMNVLYQTPDPRAFWAGAMSSPYASASSRYDPNNISQQQQMAWMQQAYAHYIAQYMQMIASGAVPPTWYSSSHTTVPVPAPQQTAEQPQPPVVNHPEQPAPPQNNNMNVADGAEEEDEGRGNRDWLDWFYTMSRVMVLFSIVYFYSSPTRFVIVSALGLMLYLYQLGFFRAQQLQAARLVAENNNEAVDARVAENNNVENQNEGAAREEGSAGAEAPDPEPDRPSLFALTWTFFTSFFASLIPEQPGAL